MPKQSEDLDILVQQAKSTIDRQTEAAARKSGKSESNRHGLALFSSGLAVCIWAVFFWHSSIGPDQIRSDLRHLLNTARVQIDNHVAQQGELPKTLSDAALARVVRYTIDDPKSNPQRYSLVAEIAGVTERWSSQ
jgi:hypothetical protein